MKQFYLVLLFTLTFLNANANNEVLVPSATIAGTTTVCQNATSPVITFTGSGGTSPYTFTYTINGSPQPTITTVTGNSITLPVSTSTPGIYIYTLVSVHDSSPPSNEQNINGQTATITVNAPPVVNFTFNNDNTCSGTTIQFTSMVSGLGPNTYSWDFGDGSPLSNLQNPTHSFTSLGCGTAAFTVTLTVVSNGCNVTRQHTVNVIQKPDINFIDVNATGASNQFNNCQHAATDPVYSITVDNISVSTCISSFTIDFGDSTIVNNAIFPISHTYNLVGAYTMIVTANGTNGCANSKTYIIKNVSNPLGGLNSPGSTQNLCAPTGNLQFSISNWGVNSLDTTYTINYGDSTPTLVLTQSQLNSSSYYVPTNPVNSANYPIPHIYTTSNCPATSFIVTLDVTNACGTTPFTLGNISIITKPVANFTCPPIACITTNVLFTNTSIPGYDGGCDTSTKYIWNFGDPSGTNNIINTGFVTSIPNANHTFSNFGTYTVTLTAQNSCGITTKTQQICIEPPLVPQFTLNTNTGCIPLAVTATNTTSLMNQCSPPAYAWNVTYASGNCGSVSAFTYTGGTSATSANPSFNFTESGTYSIQVTMTNSCGPVTSAIQTVIVKKPPTASIATIPNSCGTANITPTATVNSCAPASSTLTYAWSFPGGSPSSSNLPNPGTINYPTTGNYTVSLVVSNECGPSNTSTQSFVVNPNPVITNSILSQTICSGSQTTLVTLTANPVATTFTWTATATTGISGFTASGSTNTIPVQTITTTNTSAGTVTYVITPTVGTCIGATVNYIVTVNPAPSITTQPQPSSVCLGGTPTPLSVTLNSSAVVPTYQWYFNTSNTTVGGTLINGATNATYNPLASAVGTLYYYCVISLSSGGCSSITSNIVSVIVNPLPLITVQPTPTESICVGGTIPTLTISYSGGVGTPTYQWYSNNNSSTTGGTPVGTNANSFTPPVFNTAGTFYYYVVISLSGNGCGTVTSNAAEIIVVADPALTTQPLTTQTLCQNSTATILTVVASGGVGSYTYQWYTNPNNTVPSGTIIPGATNASYIPPTNIVGPKYYYCIISQTGLGCSVTSTIATVIVNASPTIQNQPTSSTVCLGGAPTVLSLTYTNGVGTPTYQWYSNILNSNIGGVLLTGETNPTFNPPATTAGVIYYFCVVTFPSLTGSCAIVTTNTATVTIDPGAVINQQPLPNQSLCIGNAIPNPLTVTFSGGTGTANYQWYSNANNTTTGGTPVGTNSASYTPPVYTVANTYYYYVTITFSGSGCGAITSTIAQVDVVNDPIVTTQPLATQTQCQNSTASPLSVVASGGIGTFNYQWYSNASPLNSGGTLIPGATTNTYSPLTDVVGTQYYYCVITQTGVGCNVTSAVATVIVVTAPIITTQPQSETVCFGSVLTPLTIAYSNGTGTTSYQWYDDNGIIVGATNSTYTPTNTITTGFYCIITFSSGGCTSITSNTVTVTINPLPSIDQQPTLLQSVCVGGGIGPLTVSYIGGVGTASYQWYSNTNNTTTGGNPVGTNSASYTPPVYTVANSYYYYVTISFSGSGCGSITSSVAQVDVVDDPIVTAQPLVTQTLCQNSLPSILSVTLSGGLGTTYNYQWYSSTVNNTSSGSPILGETNSTYTPSTIAAGTIYYYCLITQPSGSGCNATSNTAEVIVNVAPTVANQPSSSTVCVNQTATVLSLTYNNGLGTPTYQWYSNTTNSNGGGSIIASATNATYAPPTMTSGTTYYYCVITFPSLSGSCSVITTNPATVVVNDNPVIAAVTSTICSATMFTVTPSNAGGNIVPTGTTYTWTTPIINPIGSVTGASAATAPQLDISQTLINTTTSPATVRYTVTPTSGSCVGANFTITITVNPAINPNITLTNNACFGVNIASITTAITGGIPFSSGAPYNINWTGPNGFTSSASSISNLAPGNYDVTIDDAGGCPFSNTYTITEPADIVIAVDSENDITCFNSANGSINITVTGGTGNYVYTWTKNSSFYAATQDISNLGPGSYTVSVTDVNNCGPKTTSFTITEPPLLVVSLGSQTNVLCYGASTGVITVNVTGGNPGPGYIYSWTGPNGFTSSTQNLNNIIAGVYYLTVTDANGCSKNLTVTITQSTEIIIAYTTTPITCYGANNASLTVTLSGGNSPYQYQWSNLATTLVQTNLSAGYYTITVTDNVGCPKVLTINIPEAPIFTVNPIVSNITCFGAHNGSINLNLTGGILPVVLTWSDGSTSGLIRNNLGPGTYTATISDGTPCFIVRTFTIVEPQAIVLSANLTNAFNCTNPNSGAIDLIVSGGTPPYTYSWSNGSSTEDLNSITSGNYLVTVTDTNGCIKTAQYSIIRPNPIAINVTTQTDFDCATHLVNQNFLAQASGGIPPYQFQWSSGTISGTNNEIMHSNVNGTVLLTVTDSYGCTATQTVVVDTPQLGYSSFDATSIGYVSYGIYSIGDPIQFQSNITGDYLSVSWDFGDGTFSTEENPIHTYVIPKDYVVTQTVTYPFGCVYVQTITLIVEKGYLLVVPNAFTPNSDTINDTFRPVTKRLKNVHLDVYDTWGSLIFSEVGDVLVGWDAKIKGFSAENGNYYCKVSGETFYGTTVHENHTFVLIK